MSSSAILITNSTLQGALEARNSIYHSAVSFMNAFANAGTTSDLFLRENLEWLAKASNWSKFTTTAALGVIHKGNLAQGKTILEPYLPGSAAGPAKSVYSEGGSLYALGLVNANHGKEETTNYLLETLKGTQDEVIMHGAALGLGVAAMGSGNEGKLSPHLRSQRELRLIVASRMQKSTTLSVMSSSTILPSLVKLQDTLWVS